ncbi:hypothetical protein MMYC01_201725 [Madurella mycetomatis]|uniref:Uncharacterized protein n=1 Tax=Madurella mycetomatis TaxID=100816 RepID=A0A175WCK8_9PEZI|nr:hypothetical protein MMYC01_205148 [Madurella mycetomatis]KXX81487.1 hypothetical protein MMYC01_201725 [Madurella mycetomatis]
MDQTPAEPQEREYFLPEPEKEIQRLTHHDTVIAHAMGNRRVLAPLDMQMTGLKILDSGTADGLFLRCLESQLNPPFSLSGFDIMPSFFPSPSSTPSHTTYAVHDIADPWPPSMHGQYDLVHQRLSLAGGRTTAPRTAIRQLASCVRSGGWIQLGEMDARAPVSGGQAMHDSWAVMRAVFVAAGPGADAAGSGARAADAGRETGEVWDFAHHMAEWLREDDLGFEDVTEEQVDVRVGPSCEDREIGELGVRVLLQSSEAVLKASKLLNADVAPAVTDRLLERLETELREQGAVYRLIFVHGRKRSS